MSYSAQLKSGNLGRIKDKKYLDFVRTLPCCVCGNPETAPHHLIGHGYGGIGTKSPDYLTIPLCTRHHDEIHRPTTLHVAYKAWEDRYCSQWLHIFMTQRAWVREKTSEILPPYHETGDNEEDVCLTQMRWIMQHRSGK